MARRSSRACVVAGCPGVVVGSDYCAEHANVKRPRDERESAAARGYGHRWRKQRRMVLARSPLCADPFGVHSAAGVVELATDVHHVVPLASDAPAAVRHGESNLVALCHSCHSRITVARMVNDDAPGGGGEMGSGGEGGKNLCDRQKLDRRPSHFNSAAGFGWGGD